MIVYIISVVCDWGDCRANVLGEPQGSPGMGMLWSNAQKEGWTRESGKHFCPECSKQFKRGAQLLIDKYRKDNPS